MKKNKKAPKGETLETSTSKAPESQELSESELDTVTGGVAATGGGAVAAAPATGGTHTAEIQLSSFSFGIGRSVP
jgi:hypothetical protein